MKTQLSPHWANPIQLIALQPISIIHFNSLRHNISGLLKSLASMLKMIFKEYLKIYWVVAVETAFYEASMLIEWVWWDRKSSSVCILIIAQRDETQSSLFIIQQVHSTCFGCQPHSSSGIHKTVTIASGTGFIFCAATSLQRGQARLAS